jgi:epoxyqueuosine reductase
MAGTADRIKAKAFELGCTHVGVARAEALAQEGSRLEEWLGRGYQAGMAWMARNVEKRVDPRVVLPGAKSVIALAVNYYTPVRHASGKDIGKVSRYAWGDDYHELVGRRLEELVRWMSVEFPGSEGKAYVDTGPVMDKVWAQRAGIGWEGKHTNVITRDTGSWVFLGEILTTLELDPDLPAADHCGTCTRCIDACPTEAIVEPYVVDSSRCISYLTIEHRGDIPDALAKEFEGWIYGCDICQDVCPWNIRFAQDSREPGFAPRDGALQPSLSQWEGMTQEEFSRRFAGSAVKRTKLSGLRRNIKAVRAGQGDH